MWLRVPNILWKIETWDQAADGKPVVTAINGQLTAAGISKAIESIMRVELDIHTSYLGGEKIWILVEEFIDTYKKYQIVLEEKETLESMEIHELLRKQLEILCNKIPIEALREEFKELNLDFDGMLSALRKKQYEEK